MEKGGNSTRVTESAPPSAKPTALPWVARLGRDAAGAVAATLRLRADVKGCFIDGELWLRGDSLDDALDAAIARLAPITRFTLTQDDELIRIGNLLPERKLPPARWQALSTLLNVDRPAAALPANLPPRVGLSVIRSSDAEHAASMLLVMLQSWSQYAESASAARLGRLAFAATRDRALIAGTPLPPLDGVRLWEHGEGIVVPCGFALSPAIDAATLRRALELVEGDVALFGEDGSWELIPAGAFVPARRSAVRLAAARSTQEREAAS